MTRRILPNTTPVIVNEAVLRNGEFVWDGSSIRMGDGETKGGKVFRTGGGTGSVVAGVASTRDELADIEAGDGDRIYVSEKGLEGEFEYVIGDYKVRADADFFRGIYQPRNGVPTTTAVWRRVPLPGNRYRASWFDVTIASRGQAGFDRLFSAFAAISKTHYPSSRGTLVFGNGTYEVDDCVPLFPGVDITSENGSGYTTIRVSTNRGWLFIGDDSKVGGFKVETTGAVSPRLPGDSLAIIRSQGGGNRTVHLYDMIFDVPKSLNNAIACDVTPKDANNPNAYLKLIMRDVHVKACGRMCCEVLFHNGNVFGSNVFVDIENCSFTDPGMMPGNDRIALSLSGSMAMKRVHNCTFHRSIASSIGDGSLASVELVSGGPVDISGLRFSGPWASYISNSTNPDGFRISGSIRNLENEKTGGTGMLYISCARDLTVNNVNLKGGVQVYCQDLGDDITFTNMTIDSINESAFIAQNGSGIKLMGNYLKAAGTNAQSPIVNFFGLAAGESVRNYAQGNIIAKPSAAVAPHISGPGTNPEPITYQTGGNLLVTV